MDYEEHAEPRKRYRKQELSAILDNVIDTWREREQARSATPEAFPPPEPPGVFHNMDQLLDYHNARAGYEQNKRQLDNRKQEAEKRWDEARGQVARVLPPGTQVVYAYQGMAEREDLTYTISRTSSGEVFVSQ